MKKFRIKEEKDARTNSAGYKASWFYPQVRMFLGFYRNIRPTEMPNDEFKGDVVRFAQHSSAMNFIYRYADVKGIKKAEQPVQQEQAKVVYHEVKGW